MSRRDRLPLRLGMLAAAALSLSSCFFWAPEPGPGEWRHRDGTRGDFQEHHVASLFEQDGYGQLILECGQGPIFLRLASGREIFVDVTDRQPLGYRLDDRPPVAVLVHSTGNYLWFRDPATATDEDVMVARIASARFFTVRIDWSPDDRQLMRFDVSRAAAAVARLREVCAPRR